MQQPAVCTAQLPKLSFAPHAEAVPLVLSGTALMGCPGTNATSTGLGALDAGGAGRRARDSNASHLSSSLNKAHLNKARLNRLERMGSMGACAQQDSHNSACCRRKDSNKKEKTQKKLPRERVQAAAGPAFQVPQWDQKLVKIIRRFPCRKPARTVTGQLIFPGLLLRLLLVAAAAVLSP